MKMENSRVLELFTEIYIFIMVFILQFKILQCLFYLYTTENFDKSFLCFNTFVEMTQLIFLTFLVVNKEAFDI